MRNRSLNTLCSLEIGIFVICHCQKITKALGTFSKYFETFAKFCWQLYDFNISGACARLILTLAGLSTAPALAAKLSNKGECKIAGETRLAGIVEGAPDIPDWLGTDTWGSTDSDLGHSSICSVKHWFIVNPLINSYILNSSMSGVPRSVPRVNHPCSRIPSVLPLCNLAF